MNTVGVSELKQRTSQVLRRVREHGEHFAITKHGEVVALLIPVQPAEHSDNLAADALWAELDQLAAEIGAHWPPGLTPVEALRSDRR